MQAKYHELRWMGLLSPDYVPAQKDVHETSGLADRLPVGLPIPVGEQLNVLQ
jgi:hypothetical protein